MWPLIDLLHLDLPEFTEEREPRKTPLSEANFADKFFASLSARHKVTYDVVTDYSELMQLVTS